MIVVDSSAWIELLMRGSLTPQIRTAFPSRETHVVPTIVQLEMTKWLRREISLKASRLVLAYSQKCVVVPLSSLIAVQAAYLSAQHKLATADAIIYATAVAMNADLLTCDAHFEGLPGVTFISKAPA